MWRDPGLDQAEGLRRMLGGAGPARLAVIGGRRAGRTSVAANLAAALGSAGREVLLLDENAAPGNLESALGLAPRWGLAQVLRRARALEQAVVRGPEGVRLLACAGGQPLADACAAFSALEAGFARLAPRPDCVIIDADAQARASFAHAAGDVLVLATPRPESITAAYAGVKAALRRDAATRVHVLVNRVTGDKPARRIHARLADVAARYLGARLCYLGHVPEDAELARALASRRPLVAFAPDSPAAGALRRIAAQIAGWAAPATLLRAGAMPLRRLPGGASLMPS